MRSHLVSWKTINNPLAVTERHSPIFASLVDMGEHLHLAHLESPWLLHELKGRRPPTHQQRSSELTLGRATCPQSTDPQSHYQLLPSCPHLVGYLTPVLPRHLHQPLALLTFGRCVPQRGPPRLSPSLAGAFPRLKFSAPRPSRRSCLGGKKKNRRTRRRRGRKRRKRKRDGAHLLV